jgi:glucose/arabinose dehydrogenase
MEPRPSRRTFPYIMLWGFSLLAISINIISCNATQQSPDNKNQKDHPILSQLITPPGFTVELFATDLTNARSMAISPTGVVFVGTRTAGNVYAVIDEDKDGYAETKYTIASGLNMPNGVALRDGDLYVAEVNRIIVFRGIEAKLNNPPAPEVIYDGYPGKTHHGWKYIAFGPDGMLYVPVGAPCNICLSEDSIFASITRLDVDKKSTPEIVHSGIRNTVGFDWDPMTGHLWFTDNGADQMGDDLPADELNRAKSDYLHFGYPYCHQGDLPDPEHGSKRDCSDFIPPAKKLGPHVAALGMHFYKGDQFPDGYKGQIYVCEHGSWNRSTKIGYRVSLLRTGQGEVISYEPFIKGWLQGDSVLGRPVDVKEMMDGSLLISDDYADIIYRVIYTGEQ